MTKWIFYSRPVSTIRGDSHTHSKMPKSLVNCIVNDGLVQATPNMQLALICFVSLQRERTLPIGWLCDCSSDVTMYKYYNVTVTTGSRETQAVLRKRECDMQLRGRISWKQQHTRSVRVSTRTTSSTCEVSHGSTRCRWWHHCQQGWLSIYGICVCIYVCTPMYHGFGLYIFSFIVFCTPF